MKRIAAAALACVGGLALDGVAQAQETSLEEITVTAQRREEALQTVPISISAFTANDLERRQVNETLDIVKYVPNLVGHHNTGIGSANTYYLRGLGNTESLSTFDPPVGTYVDEFYIARQNANNFGFFDAERVEVLAGPQGTLFGRNTTGGAINIILKKPSDELKGWVEGQAGEYNQFGGRASIDVPIVPGRVLAKFSAYGYRDDGYATQVATGKKFNYNDTQGGRGQLRVLIDDAWTWDFAGTYIYEDNTNQLNVTDANGNRVSHSGQRDGVLCPYLTGMKGCLPALDAQARTTILVSNLQWAGEDITVNAITGYLLQWQGFLTDSFGETANGPSIYGSSSNATVDTEKEFTQEIKVTGKLWDDKIGYVAGFYYFRELSWTDLASAGGSGVNILAPPTVTAERTVRSSTDAKAAYAQVDYHFLPGWTFTAGLRYTDELKRFQAQADPGTRATGAAAAISIPNIVAAGIPLNQHAPVFTPRFALDYQLTPDIMLYASATRGFKSGGWNGRASSSVAFTTFRPEKNWTEEVGFRSEWFDHTLRFNATGFYSMTEKVQIPFSFFVAGVPVFNTVNPADLEVYGGEFTLNWLPLPGLNIQSGLGVSHAQYKNPIAGVLAQQATCRTTHVIGTASCDNGFVDINGDLATPVRIPPVTWSMSASYEWETPFVTIIPQLGITLDDAYSLSTSGSEASSRAPGNAQRNEWTGAQWLLDFGVTFQPTAYKSLSVTAECKNCLDKSYPASFLSPVQFLDKPGTWDVKVRWQYDAGPRPAPEPMPQPASYTPPPQAPAPATSYLVFFDFDKSVITTEASRIIANAAGVVKGGQAAQVGVTGHTDLSGSDAYNLALSKRRAQAVADQLIADGVPANEIVLSYKGKREPLVPTADGVREPQNRRAEIVLR